jgi:hypothetical protein
MNDLGKKIYMPRVTLLVIIWTIVILAVIPFHKYLGSSNPADLVSLSVPVMIFLISVRGRPDKWWVPFFGTVVRADMTRLQAREQAGEDSGEIQREIEKWVKATCRYTEKINPYSYQFLRKKDAVMFKLAWG